MRPIPAIDTEINLRHRGVWRREAQKVQNTPGVLDRLRDLRFFMSDMKPRRHRKTFVELSK